MYRFLLELLTSYKMLVGYKKGTLLLAMTSINGVSSCICDVIVSRVCYLDFLEEGV